MPLPNILYLHSHDTGRFVQPYGHAVPTPNIQKLAEEGVLFRQAFCAAPTCSPSRAALLTGQYPHNNGMLGLAHRGFALYHPEHHLVNTLRLKGYTSAAVGVQHITRRSTPIAYDEILEVSDDSAKQVAPAAARYLRGLTHQPFFFSVGFWETHRVFSPHGELDDPRYCAPPPTLPDSAAIREDFAAFKTSVRSLDEGIGVVLDALDAAGLAADTIVMCTTDHGIAFPGSKCTLTDHGISVSLIVRGPGGFVGGQVIDGLVSQIDIFPTLCELIGQVPPEWLQGKSLMPLVRRQRSEIHDQIFAEINYHAAYEPQRAVRTRRYKYIRRFAQRTKPVPPNTDDSPGKALWVESGWKDQFVPEEKLYDLVFDPNEAHNVAELPEYSDALAEMRQRLRKWMEETNDPLLHGQLPLPAGVVLNDPDQSSPNDPVHPES